MPGRKYSQGSTKYRYGFNGQEKSDEINDNLTTAEYWEYDSRIGRRWNVDPVYKHSPYECFAGNPIWLSDPYGLDPDKPGKKVGERVTGTTGKDKIAETFEWDGKKWNIAQFTPVIIVGKREKTAEQYAKEKALDQNRLITKEVRRERIRQLTEDLNISEDLATQIDFARIERKNADNIRRFNLSGNSMEKDIRRISSDLNQKILIGATAVEGSVVLLLSGAEAYGPVLNAVTDKSIEFYVISNMTLNSARTKLLTAILDLAIIKYGKDALYRKELWDLSSQVNSFKEILTTENIVNVVKQLDKILKKIH